MFREIGLDRPCKVVSRHRPHQSGDHRSTLRNNAVKLIGVVPRLLDCSRQHVIPPLLASDENLATVTIEDLDEIRIFDGSVETDGVALAASVSFLPKNVLK